MMVAKQPQVLQHFEEIGLLAVALSPSPDHLAEPTPRIEEDLDMPRS